MIELVLYSPPEGRAYVRVGGRLHLVRPPFGDVEEWPQAPEAVLHHAAHDGYRIPPAGQAQFQDAAALFAFLDHEVVRARAEQGLPIPDTVFDGDVVDLAPAEFLDETLEMIERELLPNNQRGAALRLLAAFEESERLAADTVRTEWVRRILASMGLKKELKQCSEMSEAPPSPAHPRRAQPDSRAYAARVHGVGLLPAFRAVPGNGAATTWH